MTPYSSHIRLRFKGTRDASYAKESIFSGRLTPPPPQHPSRGTHNYIYNYIYINMIFLRSPLDFLTRKEQIPY